MICRFVLLLAFYLQGVVSLVIPEQLPNSDNSQRCRNKVNFNSRKYPPTFTVHQEDSIILNEFIVIFNQDTDFESIINHLHHLQDITFSTSYWIKFDSFSFGNTLRGYLLKTNFPQIIKQYVVHSAIVDIIESNSRIYATKQIEQDKSPWGLARISKRDRVRIGERQTYFYDSEGGGEGVNVYVLDTGIQESHIQFQERAQWGITIPEYEDDIDLNGHGTHCAGIIGSCEYGVAKKTNMIAVKILDTRGDGKMSDLIKGIEFVVNDHILNVNNNTNYKGSVINLSLGAEKSIALSKVIHAAISEGINIVVAAGNENENACESSPADSKDVITVGASSFSDSRAFFSNWGHCVDVFAPGINILSTYKGPLNNETLSLSGTSMAAPHVAGLVAYFLSLQPGKDSQYFNNNTVAPLIIKKKIIGYSTNDKLYDIPKDTPNLMVFNGRGKNLSKFWGDQPF